MGSIVSITFDWSVPGCVSLVQDEDHGWLLAEAEEPEAWRASGGPTVFRASAVPALFRQFADLPEDPHAIHAFAQKYGRLWRSWPGLPARQEPVAAWSPRLAWMRHMTTLHDLILTRDRSLSRYVREEGASPPSVREPELTGNYVPKRWRGRAWWLAGREGDPTQTACQYLNDRLNEEMDRFKNAHIGATTEALLRGAPDDGGPWISLVGLRPKSLWQCLVAQLVVTIVNGLVHQRCGYCGLWLTLTGADTRADRTTCSPSCRTGLWRLRKRAKAMFHDELQPVPAIARQMGRTESEIRDWISG